MWVCECGCEGEGEWCMCGCEGEGEWCGCGCDVRVSGVCV